MSSLEKGISSRLHLLAFLSSMTAPNVDTSLGVNAVREVAVASKPANSLENKEIQTGEFSFLILIPCNSNKLASDPL